MGFHDPVDANEKASAVVEDSTRTSEEAMRPVRETDAFWAHTKEGRPEEEWQSLEDHLRGVADAASRFAAPFHAEEWARAAGLWHDIGKYSAAFQEYLRAAGALDVHSADALPRTDHSSAGAQHAAVQFPGLGHLIAYVIAGHHAGLPDADGPSRSTLRERLRKAVEPWDSAPPQLTDLPEPTPPPALLAFLQTEHAAESGLGVSLFTRMLFSALVDADFLDTERFMAPERAKERGEWPAGILARMLEALETRLKAFGPPVGEVNRRRVQVAEACRQAAIRRPGIFTLTVPTGGGKTLSSILFGLHHAREHGLRRIVYVAPFTSIIEQNADVFRDVFRTTTESGVPDPVVEHHSNLDPDQETDQSRRATEDWAAPLVVTTAVQFYESLFANRSSRCRKLHNLTGSVIILDEAQSLPLGFAPRSSTISNSAMSLSRK